MIDDTIRDAIAMQDAENYDDDIMGDAEIGDDNDGFSGNDDIDEDDEGDGEW